MEKRPGDEVALASFGRSECRGTEVRDQTEIAWYYPQFSMGNSFPDMSVTELSGCLLSCEERGAYFMAECHIHDKSTERYGTCIGTCSPWSASRVYGIQPWSTCQKRLPLLVSDSVFWGVSSTEVVLFPVNSSTRKKLRLLCVGVTFVISSSRYERTKTLGKFVILTNEVHKRRNENQSPWQICRKKLLGVTLDEHLKFTSHLKELSKRVSLKIGVMMRLKNVIPTLAKVRIYKSLILPQITYC